jgi:hypothetical protein
MAESGSAGFLNLIHFLKNIFEVLGSENYRIDQKIEYSE